MLRRSLLFTIIVVSTGCIGSGNTAAKKHRESFISYLESSDVEVVSLEQSDASINLQYVPKSSQYQELGSEIGAISGGFVRQIENGWSVNELNSEIVSEDAKPIARWYIKPAWIEEYRNNEIPPDKLTFRIIETVKFTNESS
jgi:hypothetical protein